MNFIFLINVFLQENVQIYKSKSSLCFCQMRQVSILKNQYSDTLLSLVLLSLSLLIMNGGAEHLNLSIPIPSPSRSVNFSTVTRLSVFCLYLKGSITAPINMTHQICVLIHVCPACLCVPVSLFLGVVEVRVRTSVQAAVTQLSSAPVDPAGLHVAVGSVYTLETRRDLDEHVLHQALSIHWRQSFTFPRTD